MASPPWCVPGPSLIPPVSLAFVGVSGYSHVTACTPPVLIFGKVHRILARNGCSAPFGDLSTALKRFRVSEPEEAAVSCITRVLRPKNAFRKFFLLVPAPTARAPEQARAARTLSLASPRGLDWSPFWPPLPPRGPPTWVQAVPRGWLPGRTLLLLGNRSAALRPHPGRQSITG